MLFAAEWHYRRFLLQKSMCPYLDAGGQTGGNDRFIFVFQNIKLMCLILVLLISSKQYV